MNNKQIFIKNEDILKIIKEISNNIRKKIINNEEKYLLIVLLKGGVHFFYEFYKFLNLDVNYNFIRSISYTKNKIINKKNVIKESFLEEEIIGKKIIIIDDILDSGRCFNYVCKYLEEKYKITDIFGVFLFYRDVERKYKIVKKFEYGMKISHNK